MEVWPAVVVAKDGSPKDLGPRFHPPRLLLGAVVAVDRGLGLGLVEAVIGRFALFGSRIVMALTSYFEAKNSA